MVSRTSAMKPAMLGRFPSPLARKPDATRCGSSGRSKIHDHPHCRSERGLESCASPCNPCGMEAETGDILEPRGGTACFLLGTAGSRGRAHWLRDEVVCPVISRTFEGFAVVLYDEPEIRGGASIKAVLEADIVIVDVSGPSPNVWHLVGIRQSAMKPIILMKEYGLEI